MRLFLTSLFVYAILVVEVDAAPKRVSFKFGSKPTTQVRQGHTHCQQPIVIVRSSRYDRYRSRGYRPYRPQPSGPLWGAQYYAPRFSAPSRVTYNPNYVEPRYVEPLIIENPYFKD